MLVINYISVVININLCLVILQAQFAQMRPVAIPSSVAPRMPIYPAGAPGIGQQLFYGQAPPALIPPQVRTVIIST